MDSCAAGVALALQTGRNLANDYFDGLRGVDDVRCGPPRLTASGAVAPAAVMALASFAVALGLALLALCGQWWLLGLSAAAARPRSPCGSRACKAAAPCYRARSRNPRKQPESALPCQRFFRSRIHSKVS